MSEEVFPDYYALLDVPQTATKDEIRRAYYGEIDFWHPDRYMGRSDKHILRAQARTVLLNRANAILLNPEKREIYDALYTEWKALGNTETSPPKPPSDSFDLMACLIEHNVEIIDKRAKGGCLWVVGGGELTSFMSDLRQRGIRCIFTGKGGRATQHRAAWYFSAEGQT